MGGGGASTVVGLLLPQPMRRSESRRVRMRGIVEEAAADRNYLLPRILRKFANPGHTRSEPRVGARRRQRGGCVRTQAWNAAVTAGAHAEASCPVGRSKRIDRLRANIFVIE